MSKKDYNLFRTFFVNLSDEEHQKVVAPLGKDEAEFQLSVLKSMKDFEREKGHPGKWLALNQDDMALYKPLVFIGENSKEGFL